MRKFTIKDFIAYNNPCFSCGNKISLDIGVSPQLVPENVSPVMPSMTSALQSFYQAPQQHVDTKIFYLRPEVLQEGTQINLRISYFDSLTLYVYHKTNKILPNNYPLFLEFLDKNLLFLVSTCNNCGTTITSEYLKFNLERKQLAAVGIDSEKINVNSKNKRYTLTSSVAENKSTLIVYNISSSFTLELPLIPKYAFKNKEHFIKKLSTYITFS